MNNRKIPELIKKKLIFNQKYKCIKCCILLPYTYEIDHIVPYSISKNNEINNLQALCPNCHALKTKEDNINIRKWKSDNLMDIETSTYFTCYCNPGFKWKNERNFKKHFSSLRHGRSNMMEID
jgi:5-methylcytosine-specific restriction endonuclease McrA